jgi:DNA repair exonuclease SbcCD ATPase subunit
MDETINNLDAETVSQVARLFALYIEDMQTRAIDKKMYVITHSDQLQRMQMRDGTVIVQ